MLSYLLKLCLLPMLALVVVVLRALSLSLSDPFALALQWLYLTTVLLSLRPSWLWWRVPERRTKWTATPLLLWVLLALAREGAFPFFHLDISDYYSTADHHCDITDHEDEERENHSEARLADFDVQIDGVEVQPPGGALAERFRTGLVAANPPSGHPQVHISVALSGVPDRYCYLPLYKSADLSYRADVTFHWV